MIGKEPVSWFRSFLKSHTAHVFGVLVLSLGLTFFARAESLRLGVNALWGPGEEHVLRERFRKARAIGVSEIRIDWEWRQVEQRRGYYVWESLDVLVRVAFEEGIALLPVVHYAPEWALVGESKADDGYELAPREDAYGDFGAFVLASIKRYGPNGTLPGSFMPIRSWQIWNEPNTGSFWGPQPDPVAFGRLMQEVDLATRDVRHSVQIVHAGLAKADVGFLERVWKASPTHGETFDVLAIHPYLFDWEDGVRWPEEMDEDDPRASSVGYVGSLEDPGFLGKVFNLQLFLTLRGVLGKPIWLTEMGYFVGRQKMGVTEEEQAVRAERTLAYIRQRLLNLPFGEGRQAIAANVQRLYWFSLEDFDAPDGYGSFGVYRPNGSIRPVGPVLLLESQR